MDGSPKTEDGRWKTEAGRNWLLVPGFAGRSSGEGWMLDARYSAFFANEDLSDGDSAFSAFNKKYD